MGVMFASGRWRLAFTLGFLARVRWEISFANELRGLQGTWRTRISSADSVGDGGRTHSLLPAIALVKPATMLLALATALVEAATTLIVWVTTLAEVATKTIATAITLIEFAIKTIATAITLIANATKRIATATTLIAATLPAGFGDPTFRCDDPPFGPKTQRGWRFSKIDRPDRDDPPSSMPIETRRPITDRFERGQT
jgi:hypothetical protein